MFDDMEKFIYHFGVVLRYFSFEYKKTGNYCTTIIPQKTADILGLDKLPGAVRSGDGITGINDFDFMHFAWNEVDRLLTELAREGVDIPVEWTNTMLPKELRELQKAVCENTQTICCGLPSLKLRYELKKQHDHQQKIKTTPKIKKQK